MVAAVCVFLECLCLQRVSRGIKRTQCSPVTHRLPVTDSIMDTIYLALDLSIHDHCMFWAACTLFWIFTFCGVYSPEPGFHLAYHPSDSSGRFHGVSFLSSSLDQGFQNGSVLHRLLCSRWPGKAPLCAVQATLAFLTLRGNVPGPVFLLQSS